MSQDNQFHQYGYNHYLKAPTRPQSNPRLGGTMRENILRKVQSPAIATVALVAAAALFVGVIVATYPSGDDTQKQIPIIKADLRPFKTFPDDRGGMVIPHRESTILARADLPALSSDRQEIENLFARTSEDLVTKEQAIERAMAVHPMAPAVTSTQMEEDNIPTLLREEPQKEAVSSAVDIAAVQSVDEGHDIVVLEPSFKLKEPTAKDILQKIGSSNGNSQENSAEFSSKVVSAAMSVKPHRAQMHAAATSPETLDFVRGILSAKEQPMQAAPSAAELAAIAPAVGTGSAVNITSGSYFVQLASITDATRAGKEWSKMQVKYDVLATSKFRVQEAALNRGTFYRIQAGPMSKSSANAVCDALKQANKPGGCLVVK
ncbi:MAG: hypothetical protein COB14_01375 [Alphaproteobacteria bacterium]|nr:MAG: hypothetical protein COB14_01375 [Alphaproteobacteria bacterium]